MAHDCEVPLDEWVNATSNASIINMAILTAKINLSDDQPDVLVELIHDQNHSALHFLEWLGDNPDAIEGAIKALMYMSAWGIPGDGPFVDNSNQVYTALYYIYTALVGGAIVTWPMAPHLIEGHD
jgi:hypothetical protein